MAQSLRQSSFKFNSAAPEFVPSSPVKSPKTNSCVITQPPQAQYVPSSPSSFAPSPSRSLCQSPCNVTQDQSRQSPTSIPLTSQSQNTMILQNNQSPRPVSVPIAIPVYNSNELEQHLTREQEKFAHIHKKLNVQIEKEKKRYLGKLENYVARVNDHNEKNDGAQPLDIAEAERIVVEMMKVYTEIDAIDLDLQNKDKWGVYQIERYREKSENVKLRNEIRELRYEVNKESRILNQMENELNEQVSADLGTRDAVQCHAMKEAYRLHKEYKKQIQELEQELSRTD